MKLLFDENLSFRLVSILAADFPGSAHVTAIGLAGRPDREIWDTARRDGWIVVSKDDDFQHLGFLYGAPPKVIRLRIGNAPTSRIAHRLSSQKDRIAEFLSDGDASVLLLD